MNIALFGIEPPDERETAILIWIVILAFAALKIAGWDAVKSVLKALWNFVTNRYIAFAIFIFLSYTLAAIYILHLYGVWQQDQVKNSVIWFGSVGAASFFRLRGLSSAREILKKWVADHLKIIAFIEFVVANYTLGYFSEFVIVGVASFISIALAFTPQKEELKQARSILEWTLTVIGLLLVAFAVAKMIEGFWDFATWRTFRDFYTPPLLSFSVLPILYVLFVLIKYEEMFRRTEYPISDKRLRAHARRAAVFAFRGDADALRRWTKQVIRMKPLTREEVQSTIELVKSAKSREKHPPIIDPSAGWAPLKAGSFLAKFGLKTADYHRSYSGWMADSEDLKIDDGLIASDIAYRIEGGEVVVRKLLLFLNINEMKTADEGKDFFWKIFLFLAKESLPRTAALRLFAFDLDTLPPDSVIEEFRVRSERQDRGKGTPRASFEITLSIDHSFKRTVLECVDDNRWRDDFGKGSTVLPTE